MYKPFTPNWIREFSYPNWTNVFQLVPNNHSLYPIALRSDWKTEFNDWNGRILLLAKDGCPTRVIRDRVLRGETKPWRLGQRELGDEMGWKTNEQLFRLASMIPGGKLYGSAAANMLYDDDRSSRSLPGLYDGTLHDYLRQVLLWVIESMPHVKWIACLGFEAWFLSCVTIGKASVAPVFKEFRDSGTSLAGTVAGSLSPRFRYFIQRHA